MSSTILYKFRSGQTFEALPLPGSAARLFDVKKAIVIAKKLDQGSMDFDLSVRDATTNEEYTDDAMLLPRGTRLIVKRLPVPPNAKGQGLLAKIARSQYFGIAATSGTGHAAATAVAGGPGSTSTFQQTGTPHDFYTIDGRARDDDEEFVNSGADIGDEEKELAALRAATDAAASSGALTSSVMGRGIRPNAGGFRPGQPVIAGAGGPPPQRPGLQPSHNNRYRPNADPELREQERQAMPKKRATGIPRTFLNLKVNNSGDGTTGEGGDGTGTDNVPLLQPNTIGFEELVHRGGGQSENTAGTKRDFEYALKLTATTVPEYLQCAICHSIVKNAVILTWDVEGRTTCEKCIRDALAQNGFRCPLTGQEGVSPDDLIPNHALRKAADQFTKGVMAKMEEIEKNSVDDDLVENEAKASGVKDFLEGDGTDKGVILSRRTTAAEKKRKQDDSDPFGGAGDDPFGGDVFAVEADLNDDEANGGPDNIPLGNDDSGAEAAPVVEETILNEQTVSDDVINQSTLNVEEDTIKAEEEIENPTLTSSPQNAEAVTLEDQASLNDFSRNQYANSRWGGQFRREPYRRRGPPVGYVMGPAGAPTDTTDEPESTEDQEAVDQNNFQYRHNQGNYQGSTDSTYRGGRGGRFSGRGRFVRGGRYDGGRGGGRYFDPSRGAGRSSDGGRFRGGRSTDSGQRHFGGRYGDNTYTQRREYQTSNYDSSQTQREDMSTGGSVSTQNHQYTQEVSPRPQKRQRSESDARSDEASYNDSQGRTVYNGGRIDAGQSGRGGRGSGRFIGGRSRGGGYRGGRMNYDDSAGGRGSYRGGFRGGRGRF